MRQTLVALAIAGSALLPITAHAQSTCTITGNEVALPSAPAGFYLVFNKSNQALALGYSNGATGVYFDLPASDLSTKYIIRGPSADPLGITINSPIAATCKTHP